jgi:phage-related protein
MNSDDKSLVWLSTMIKTPPLSKVARIETGYLLRLLQAGEYLSMPHSRPMPNIGKKCHELRILDDKLNWRLFYRIDEEVIVILHWTSKKTQSTAKKDIDLAISRLKSYDKIRGIK